MPTPIAPDRNNGLKRTLKLAMTLVALLAVLLTAVSPVSAKPKQDKRDKQTTVVASSEELSATTESIELFEIVAEPTDALIERSIADVTQEQLAEASESIGSLATVAGQIGADALWADGITGEGVHVAVIDTGVAPVPALQGPDKVVALVDLSFEASNEKVANLDTYGHGTHMSGIIAGNDPASGFRGIAPGAGIVSVKVGDGAGVVDVSQVIAGIDWVIQHRNSDGLNIRVLNLSYSSDSTQDTTVDPLAYAVERAWDAGIVVVVAAGNDGRKTETLANPARDPFVIAVGAASIEGNDVRAADFSTCGDGVRNPDIIAPGVSIESLRVPGSRIDTDHPEARVGDDLFRGSGSSQSAAVVSGAVALLLEARPELTPDQVKAILIRTATDAKGKPEVIGNGLVNVAGAADAPTPGAEAVQDWPRSTGLGSLEDARGSRHVTVDGVDLIGELTAFWTDWDSASWSSDLWSSASWSSASWSSDLWSSASWSSASWSSDLWSSASWSSASWSSASWSGASWSSASWSSASWSSASWT